VRLPVIGTVAGLKRWVVIEAKLEIEVGTGRVVLWMLQKATDGLIEARHWLAFNHDQSKIKQELGEGIRPTTSFARCRYYCLYSSRTLSGPVCDVREVLDVMRS